MGKLSKKDVQHVASLAKLKLTPQETAKFQKQLSEVVLYVSELSQVDTTNVEPTSQTTGLTNVVRNDAPKTEGLTTSEALSGTEKTHNDYFIAPQLIEKT